MTHPSSSRRNKPSSWMAKPSLCSPWHPLPHPDASLWPLDPATPQQAKLHLLRQPHLDLALWPHWSHHHQAHHQPVCPASMSTQGPKGGICPVPNLSAVPGVRKGLRKRVAEKNRVFLGDWVWRKPEGHSGTAQTHSPHVLQPPCSLWALPVPRLEAQRPRD